jgi:type I restriction enzyme M protein
MRIESRSGIMVVFGKTSQGEFAFEAKKSVPKALKAYQKKMSLRIADESRALLKERFNYPVFLYEAEKVGITATGEPDGNEMYPNIRISSGIDKSALEYYKEFCEDPTPFFV